MHNVLIVDEDELLGDERDWQHDRELLLAERGLLFEIFRNKHKYLRWEDFRNCTLNMFNKAIKGLTKHGYIYVFDNCCLIFTKKQNILSYKVIDYVRKSGYNMTKGNKKPMIRTDYTEEFNEFFSIYPKRIGINNKKEAYREWVQRIIEGHTADEMIKAATNYQVFCNNTGKTGTEFVRAAKTFIGTDKIFLENLKNVSYNKKQTASDNKGKFNAAKFIDKF